MIRRNKELDDFERKYARDVLGPQTYSQALAIFAALWAEAVRLNPDFPADWEEDIAADIELARVLNGLPKNT